MIWSSVSSLETLQGAKTVEVFKSRQEEGKWKQKEGKKTKERAGSRNRLQIVLTGTFLEYCLLDLWEGVFK
jgi:hypothetical protein